MKMLFVGATGNIGSRVVPFLRQDFDLILAARGGGEVAGLPVIDADITDWEATLALVQNSGADVLVNCAIQTYQHADGSRFSWREPDVMRAYHSGAVEVNVKGAFHLYEAAKRAGLGRVIYISSLTVVFGSGVESRLNGEPFEAEPPEFPADIYACTKHCGEEMGRVYASGRRNPLDVFCLRLGQPYPTDVTDARTVDEPGKRCHAVAHGDIAGAIASAARSPLRGYHEAQIVSLADENLFDLSAARKLGYQPKYRFGPHGLEAPDGSVEAY